MIRLYDKLIDACRRGGVRAYDELMQLGGLIVWPVERFFAATFGRALQLIERIERVDDWLLGMVRLAAWPFRVLGRTTAAVGRLAVPATVRDCSASLAVYVQRLGRRLGTATWGIVERLNLDGFVRRLVWLVQPAWRPVAALLGFAYAWCATRPYRKMVWGLPALALLVPVGGAVAWGLTWGRASVEGRYRAAVRVARSEGDRERTELFERKLAQLGVVAHPDEFQAALKLEGEGSIQDAYVRMQALAPENGGGYAPAHVWLVTSLLDRKLELPADERLRLIDVHLSHLERRGLGAADRNWLRAAWLAERGDLEAAAALMEPLINANPFAAMMRMRLDLALGRHDDARHDARAVRAHILAAQERNEGLDAQQFEAWTQAEQLLGDSVQFARAARGWLAIDPDHPTARAAVASVAQGEFQTILASTRPNADELAQRLVELARLAEGPDALELEIGALYRRRRESPALAAMFDRLAAMDDAPLGLFSAVGTAAALAGDITRARALLQRVVAAQGDQPVAWNNLAWAFTQEPDPDLDRALSAVNRALDLAPDDYRFRETRGQIFVALGRWAEAVDDLEFALNGMPDVPAIHLALAQAYDGLGQAEIAELHRQQAQ